MDALSRADRALEHALAQRDGVVTPDTATSPMDEASTVRIPRAAIADAEPAVVTEPEPAERQQR